MGYIIIAAVIIVIIFMSGKNRKLDEKVKKLHSENKYISFDGVEMEWPFAAGVKQEDRTLRTYKLYASRHTMDDIIALSNQGVILRLIDDEENAKEMVHRRIKDYTIGIYQEGGKYKYLFPSDFERVKAEGHLYALNPKASNK